jgi:DNA-binding FadR family transcriptional regulator
MDAVLAHLRDAIERGEFAVGGKLPSEAVLSRDFAVSRSVVREALRGLQALGLTVSRTGKGTFVVSSQPTDGPRFGTYSARDLVKVRRHVEVPAAGYAAARHSADDLHALTELLERMEHETDNTVWVALDSLFHITIAHASGNPVFGSSVRWDGLRAPGQAQMLAADALRLLLGLPAVARRPTFRPDGALSGWTLASVRRVTPCRCKAYGVAHPLRVRRDRRPAW